MLGRTAWMIVGSCAIASGQSTTRVSVSSQGVQASGGSWIPSCSANGRIVAFQSGAPDLVEADSNGVIDVFVHDRGDGRTSLVSTDFAGGPANAQSLGPRISSDGWLLAFCSDATDLVTADANGVRDVFVADLVSRRIERVSVSSAGAEANGASATSIFQGYGEVHHSPYTVDISSDGRFVAFESDATNLVAGDTNAKNDIFVRDRVAGTTQRASVRADGSENPGTSRFARISGDGSRVSFWTNGQLVAADQNQEIDSYVRDLATGTTYFVSVPYGSGQSNDSSFALDISTDGRFALFSCGSNPVIPPPLSTHTEMYVRDLANGVTTVVSTTASGVFGNNYSGLDLSGALSGDGRYVLFDSFASNFVPGDTDSNLDLYVKDRLTGAIERVDVSSSGTQTAGSTRGYSLSDDGRIAVFHATMSVATLVAGDTNGDYDAFARDRLSNVPPVTSFCTAKTNSAGCVPAISTSGEPRLTGFDAFHVSATNVLSQQRGTFFWGAFSGAIPFGNGWRCVHEPLMRTPSQSSAGNPNTVDCSGWYSFDFSQAYMGSASVLAGVTLHGQFWSRDPGFAAPNDVGLTNAIRFTPAP